MAVLYSAFDYTGHCSCCGGYCVSGVSGSGGNNRIAIRRSKSSANGACEDAVNAH